MMPLAESGWRKWSDHFTSETIAELDSFEKSSSVLPETPSKDVNHFGILPKLTSDAEGKRNEFYVSYSKPTEGLRYRTNLIEYLMKMIVENDPRALLIVQGLKDVSILLKRSEEAGLCFYGFTVLSLSIVFQCEEIALAILNRTQKGDPIDVKDKAGWTPLHHAVITRLKKVSKLLKMRGADKNAPDNQGLSPFVLKKMTSITKEDKRYQVLFRVPGESEDRPILASELVQKYGHLFSEHPKKFLPYAKVSRKALYDYWKRNNEGWCETFSIDWDWMSDIPPRKDTYQFRFPMLLEMMEYYSQDSIKKRMSQSSLNTSVALRVITHDDAGKEQKLNLGIGVYATQNLSKGDLAALYGGKVGFYPSSRYILDIKDKHVICAKKNRGIGSCVAHSYPDAFFAGYDSVMLCSDVKKDEMISVIYEHMFKENEQVVELRPKALEDFANSHNYSIATSQIRYVNVISRRSILIFYLKGIYKRETINNATDDHQKCINLCAVLYQTKPELALALAESLIYQCYDYNSLVETLNKITPQQSRM